MHNRKPSSTVVVNRGVGDKRVRDLEQKTERLTEIVGKVLGIDDWYLDDDDSIRFVESLPEKQEKDVVYAVYDSQDEGFSLGTPIIFTDTVPHPSQMKSGIVYAICEETE